MRRRRGGTLAATLRHPDFRALVVADAVSDAGSWVYVVALTVYVFDRTHSPAWVGLVTIGRLLPAMVFGAYGGVLADRFERVRLMRSIDLIATVLMALLALDVAAKGSPALTIVLAAVNSTLLRAYDPAAAALTPELVPEDDLAAANTLRNTVQNLAVIAGPGLGALLLALGPPVVCIVINGATFLFGAVVVSRIRTRSNPVDVTEGGSAGVFRQTAVGMRTLVSSPSTLLVAAFSIIATFVYGTDTVMFVEISLHRLATGTNGYGLLLAGTGVGGVLAAGIANRIASWSRLASALLLGMGFYCVPSILFVDVHSPVIGFLIEVVRGGGTLIVDVAALTAIQRTMPRQILGRAMGAFMTLAIGAGALGSVVAPALLGLVGLNGALWVLALVLPVLCVLGWPKLAAMDRANLGHFALLAPRIALLERAALFAEAPRAALEQLADASREITVTVGTDVVRQGEEADALYLVRAGRLTVHALGDDGQGRELAHLGEGDVFGEIGLLRRVPRTATVTAEESVDLLRVDGESFLDVLARNGASTSLLEGAAARLARSTRVTPRVVASVMAQDAPELGGEVGTA